MHKTPQSSDSERSAPLLSPSRRQKESRSLAMSNLTKQDAEDAESSEEIYVAQKRAEEALYSYEKGG